MLKNKLFLDYVDVWFKVLKVQGLFLICIFCSEVIVNCIKNNNIMYVCLVSSLNLYDFKLLKG